MKIRKETENHDSVSCSATARISKQIVIKTRRHFLQQECTRKNNKIKERNQTWLHKKGVHERHSNCMFE